MYRAFFGFREKPFNLTPDPKFLYLNASYREALAALHYGVVERKGFVSLIGEAGTGKTTLLRRLLAELPRETRSVLVINPAIGFEEMLRFILSDLGKPPPAGATKLDMLEALNAELLDSLARGGNVVVLIDEAQDLTIPVLEELRLLSNLETAKEKILQLVIAGQPELDGILARKEIRQLRQRISVSARLRPLVRKEVEAYVGARIAAAGGDVRGLFTRPALFRLWWFSGGVPRLVNAACDNALVNAYAAGRRTIRWREIGEAMRDLRRQVSWAPGRLKTIVAMLAAAALGAAAVFGGLWLVRGNATPRVGIPGPVATVAVERTVEAGAVAPIAATARAEPTVVPAAATSPAPTAAETAAPTVTPEPPKPTVLVEALGASSPAPPAATASQATVAPTVDPVPTSSPAPAAVATEGARPSPDATIAAASPEATGTTETRKVRVNEGDNLTTIAVRHYGSASPRVLAAIRAANPWLDDPDVIWVGKDLVLPGVPPGGASATH